MRNYFNYYKTHSNLYPNWGDGKIHPSNVQIHVFQGILEFYALESISAMAKTIPFKHSHEKWLKEFTEFKNKYNTQFANAFFDYTVLACLGEARHADAASNYEIKGFPNADGTVRRDIYRCPHFEPKSALQVCALLYSHHDDWKPQYGGKPWEDIAKGGLYYYSDNPSVFIDYMVDLSHNNGVFFNKCNHIFRLYTDEHVIKEFLSMKRYQTPETVYDYCRVSCSLETVRFFKRAINLGIIQFAQVVPHRAVGYTKPYTCDLVLEGDYEDTNLNAIMNYVPIKWGTSVLTPSDIINHDGWANREAARNRAQEREWRKERRAQKKMIAERYNREGYSFE